MSRFATLTIRATITLFLGCLLIPFCAAQVHPLVRVTKATLALANPPRGNQSCPATLEFNGTITTSGPAEVKYTWVSFDGGTWPEGTLHFANAGTQTVHQQWKLGAPGDSKSGWLQLKVLSPNVVVSPQVKFVVNCGSTGPGGGPVRVTKATLVANYPKNARCPLNVTFEGTITTSGPAEVKYTWVSFDGGTWPEHTLNFKAAGTEKVSEQRQVPSNQTGWMQLKVLTPNVLESPRANYKVVCTK